MEALVPLIALIALCLSAFPFGYDSRPDFDQNDRDLPW